MLLYNTILPPECLDPDTDGPTGEHYRGTMNRTVSGRACQPWFSNTPNDIAEYYRTLMESEHNYCRNPDRESHPWCYNGEGSEPSWELCDIPFCAPGTQIELLSAAEVAMATAAQLHVL